MRVRFYQFWSLYHSNDDISLFASCIDISVCLDDLFQREGSVDDGFDIVFSLVAVSSVSVGCGVWAITLDDAINLTIKRFQ